MVHPTPLTPTTYKTAIIIALVVLFISTIWKRLTGRREEEVPEACTRIGLERTSNITDEHDSKYDGETQEEEGNTWRVKSLWIYPVKSCKGFELDQGTITGLGMQYDRQFSFARCTTVPAVDEQTPARFEWKFITQREVPALATVNIEVWEPDPWSPAYSPNHPNVQSEGVLVIRWPREHGVGREHVVHVPLNPTADQIEEHGYKVENMVIWQDNPQALMMASTGTGKQGGGRKNWIQGLVRYLDSESRRQNPARVTANGHHVPGFSYDLTTPVALFRIAGPQPRQVFRNAPREEELGYQPIVGFQDAYPLHLLNLASVHDVGSKLQKDAPPLSILNFRPNIMVTGGRAFAEDQWKLIRIGASEYDVSCRTGRCMMPNVEQSSGKRHGSEPNKTLKANRRIDPGMPEFACLGMQMVPIVKDEKEIRVGDEVEVLEVTEKHFYLLQ